MKHLESSVQSILSGPTPGALVTLQGALLVSGRQGETVDRTLDVAGHFFAYLSDLQSKMSARQYSELASLLDIGAVGMVALENVLVAEKEEFWKRLLLGGLAESLMVAASRQYIKGWATETDLVHTQAAWYLAEALWHVSAEMQSGLAPEQRWQAIQALLAPAHDHDVSAADKAILLGHIFQMLLVTYLVRLMSDA